MAWHDEMDGADLHKKSLVNYRSGSPAGVTTPTTSAEIFVDVTNKKVFFANGATNANWIKITGVAEDVMTSTGDMLYTNSAGAQVALNLGGVGKVIVSDGVRPVYSDRLTKNWIMDGGGFEIAQACPVVSTDVTDPASLSYPVFDLWQVSFNHDSGTPPTIKHSQELITSGALNDAFFCYNQNFNGAGANLGANSYYRVIHHSEHMTRKVCGNGKTVTLVFDARSDISNKKIGFHAQQGYGTGGSPSSAEVINGGNETLTTDWKTISHTFTTNTLTDKTFGTDLNDRFSIYLWSSWGANQAACVGDTVAEDFVGSGNVQIANVRLIEGSIALPTEKMTYAEALRACQRFYEKSYAYGTAPGSNTYVGRELAQALVAINASTAGDLETFGRKVFSATKRIANPSIIIYARDGTANAVRTNAGANRTGVTVTSYYLNEKGFMGLTVDDTNTTTIGANELCEYQWTADARF